METGHTGTARNQRQTRPLLTISVCLLDSPLARDYLAREICTSDPSQQRYFRVGRQSRAVETHHTGSLKAEKLLLILCYHHKQQRLGQRLRFAHFLYNGLQKQRYLSLW